MLYDAPREFLTRLPETFLDRVDVAQQEGAGVKC